MLLIFSDRNIIIFLTDVVNRFTARKELFMDMNEILAGIDCSCGVHHECDIEKVYIEKGAISRLSDLCRGYKRILLVADKNTYAVAGERVEAALSDKELGSVIFYDGLLIPNEQAIDGVYSFLQKSELIIAIGSGVIQDLCKYVSHFGKVPYIVVATAPSMDGYASNGAAMILGGMKVTVAATLPRAIIADTDIIANAPMDMIRAGYGDIIGKYSALCDWRLSHIVNGEYFCQYIYDTTYEMIEKTRAVAEGLFLRDKDSVRTLMEALICVGIMMSFAGSSRPASGSEHHLSHFFEIVGIVKKEPYFAHGIDVAYSTVVTAGIREKILKSTLPNVQYRQSRESYEAKMREVFGEVGDRCTELQERVGSYACDRLSRYKEKEKEIRSVLSEMPSADEIEAMLSVAGLDTEDFYKMYGEEKIESAVLYAKDLKDRYTVLWMNYDIFGEG